MPVTVPAAQQPQLLACAGAGQGPAGHRDCPPWHDPPPPQEQHGRGGSDGDAAAPGRNLFEFTLFMYVGCLGLYQV